MLAGAPRIRVRVQPRFDWGRARPQLTQGSHHLRHVGPDQVLRLTTSVPLAYVLREEPCVLTEPASLILGPDESPDLGPDELAAAYERDTLLYWRTWARRLALPLEWQDVVIRAAITLELCVHEDTGAIVAALTTSIPEAPGTQLPGYRGHAPVRRGNQPCEHFQHDVYGNIVLGAMQAFRDRRLLHPAGEAEFRLLETVGEQAWRVHDQPDAGMWELRTRARVHTSSMLTCWAACDRLAKIAARSAPSSRPCWRRASTWGC